MSLEKVLRQSQIPTGGSYPAYVIQRNSRPMGGREQNIGHTIPGGGEV